MKSEYVDCNNLVASIEHWDQACMCGKLLHFHTLAELIDFNYEVHKTMKLFTNEMGEEEITELLTKYYCNKEEAEKVYDSILYERFK